MNKVDKIVKIVGQRFRSFGGEQENPYNPISTALRNQSLQFAAGVDIKAVVEVVLDKAQDKATPPDPQHGRDVKPLAQYLDEYIEHEVELVNVQSDIRLYEYDSWREMLEQALDAYESTEQVKIRIERV